ncbi:hypothetical protein [Algoriphagus sp. Y33]|uniref:hypothetical protein n=1 Tax=Algoriphagus sp. Y33 TaxID=2772483 RepID=UPI0017862FEA|nr:hypothetical protein [Algoriphagus sp. Y33]
MNILTEITTRATSPTPPFFRKLKKAGLLITAVGTAVLTAPGVVPAVLLTYAGYVVTAGTVLISISQLAVDDSPGELQLN